MYKVIKVVYGNIKTKIKAIKLSFVVGLCSEKNMIYFCFMID